eukprot:CAMPEP_0179185046 /NCGR_PEP_ID=MMETSP0796-20121207/91755_1 /TAXON_ID=73915 /ORGANISM="Pyrodinium bahamense, Strain pbaha01" /LENGTH=52 /DNA_ID=CAMNT_0020888999 /DNA_START=73 /DNA_END=229 /DNA_ORIENTATION=-
MPNGELATAETATFADPWLAEEAKGLALAQAYLLQMDLLHEEPAVTGPDSLG